ncbi:hypothetical protein CTI12_AA002380 [Artemisia annua]|uniref:Uncharacterized protein n=1 Tax=Artemisia annua TaxID=35608 RepID=A0A2U1QNX6_ARTAN|nr:hypothetical protein CTI12_AA002380 [Artemisia annua]
MKVKAGEGLEVEIEAVGKKYNEVGVKKTVNMVFDDHFISYSSCCIWNSWGNVLLSRFYFSEFGLPLSVCPSV